MADPDGITSARGTRVPMLAPSPDNPSAPPVRRGRLFRSSRDERGAAIVEAGIVSLVFFTLLFGIIESGLAFRDYLTTANIARSGARVASGHANDVDADYQVVQAVQKAAKGIGNGTLNYIVVFKATDFTTSLATMSPTCAAGTSVSGTCNVYTPTDFARPTTDFTCSATLPSPDKFWCPNSRKIAASTASGGPPDYIGVYVKVTHRNIFKIWRSSFTFTDQTIIRIEPRLP
jgi:Flp pilus assembly protein TadG